MKIKTIIRGDLFVSSRWLGHRLQFCVIGLETETY